jgi:hypothetical protein
MFSSQTYNNEVSEPYDFRISKNRKLLIVANRNPNILFINVNDLANT